MITVSLILRICTGSKASALQTLSRTRKTCKDEERLSSCSPALHSMTVSEQFSAWRAFLKSAIGSSWSRIRPPSTDYEGKRIDCDPDDETCSLHLHSVTNPHNFGRIFSSPAPGFVMGVGSIGDHLLPYDECDTFLSTDAGVTWTMIRKDAHIYECGDQGSILVIVNDEEGVDVVRYSSDLGQTWFVTCSPIRCLFLTIEQEKVGARY